MKTPETPLPANDETVAHKTGLFVLMLGMLVLSLSFLSSCNTTRGLGRDVQKAGTAIEREANRVQYGN